MITWPCREPPQLCGRCFHYLLINTKQDRYVSEEFGVSRTFASGYRLFAAYTHSSARTNAALDYVPTVSLLGPQQNGPLAWDVPNRVISWGWLPLLLPKLQRKTGFRVCVRTFSEG